MSSTLSYLHAKSILSEVEKDRIVCTFLNSTEPNAIDWDKAASEFGSASVQSYKKGISNTTNKIKEAMKSGVEPGAADATPAKKGGGGKKRKEKSAEAEAEADGEAEDTPAKKKRGGRKTKAQKEAEAAAAAVAQEAEDDVKAELSD